MVFLKKTALLLLVAVLCCCSGCREYWPDEAKAIYFNNTEVFEQVFDVCKKYQITNSVVCDYKLNYQDSYKKLLTKEEKTSLTKCADIGCRNVSGGYVDYVEIQEFFVSFSIHHPTGYQGIVIFDQDVDATDLIVGGDSISLEEFFARQGSGMRAEYEMLDENIYYFYLTP